MVQIFFKRRSELMNRNKHKSKKTKLVTGLLACVTAVGMAFTTSCTTEEEPPLITVESGDDTLDYSFVTCVRDDLYSVVAIKCEYSKNAEQEVFFPVSGKKIDKVYVNIGDEVKKGDVLASLNIGSLKTDIEDLEYSIKRNELLLGYVSEQESLDMQSVYLDFAYSGGFAQGNEEYKDNRLKSITEGNDRTEQGYNDTLEFDKRKLSKLKKDYSDSMVYADFDGTVSYVADGLEGSTTNIEKCIMRIIDNEEGYFETEASDYVSYFSEGEKLNMKVLFGDGKGEYELLPMNMDQWGDKQYFSIASGEKTAELGAGSRGEIYIVTDERKDALCIPVSTVRYAGDDSYVYVLNDSGLRDVRWITTGIEYDGKVEVTSGLEEGEKVITR